jgi:hypothetical protein
MTVVKKYIALRNILVVAAVVMMSGCGSSTANGQPKGKAASSLPAQQTQFCQILERGFAERKRLEAAIPAEPNPFRQDELKKQLDQLEPNTFESLYKLIGLTGQFNGWRGTLGWDRPDPNGLVQMTVGVICAGFRFVEADLWSGYSYGEPKGDLRIPVTSTLGKALIAIDPGTKVVASGRFVWAHDTGTMYNANRMPYSICAKYHFHTAWADKYQACVPEVASGGVTAVLLVQFTSVARAQ